MVIEKAQVDAELIRLTRLRSAHAEEQYRIRASLRHSREEVQTWTERLANLREDLTLRHDTSGDKFRIELDKQTLDNRGVAGELLLRRAEKIKTRFGEDIRIGRFAGFDLFTSINYEGLPPVAPEFDVAALRANILDSQSNGQPYREFTRRAMAGGVQGYIAFLRGKRVTYWGRTGDQHTEWFPGVGHGISHGDPLHDAKRKLALVYIGMATDKFSDADAEIFALLSKERALKDEIERAQKNN